MAGLEEGEEGRLGETSRKDTHEEHERLRELRLVRGGGHIDVHVVSRRGVSNAHSAVEGARRTVSRNPAPQGPCRRYHEETA